MPEDCAKKAITGDSLVFDYEVREFTLLDKKQTNQKTKPPKTEYNPKNKKSSGFMRNNGLFDCFLHLNCTRHIFLLLSGLAAACSGPMTIN